MERQTSKPEYVQPIVDAIRQLDSGSEDDVLEAVFLLVKDRLFPADFMVLPNGEPRWRNQALHMIDGLVEEGIVIKKAGVLSLNEKRI